MKVCCETDFPYAFASLQCEDRFKAIYIAMGFGITIAVILFISLTVFIAGLWKLACP
jgi:hypothetical protein